MSQTNPQSQADHQEAAVVLDRIFTGEQTTAGPGGPRVLEVQRHIAECDACRRRFDQLAMADRALLGGADHRASGGFERGFRDAAVMGAIDDLLAAEKGVEDGGQADADVVAFPGSSAWQRLATPLSAAAALVLVIGAGIWASGGLDPLGGTPTGSNGDEFQPRTATPVERARAYQRPEIELFCARGAGADMQFQGSRDAPFGLLSCPNDATFQIGYRSSDPALRYAAFFGVDPNGAIYWYGPSPVREESWPVQPHEKITPVGDTIELDVNHQPGQVRVYALFTPEPMRYPALDRMLERADTGALFESGDFEGAGFDGAWATEVFEVVEEGGR